MSDFESKDEYYLGKIRSLRKRIAELSQQLTEVRQWNKRHREQRDEALERIAELEEAIRALPVEELVHTYVDGTQELQGYEMQAQGEWVRVLELLEDTKKAHTVHKLNEDQDQSAFVFTARLQGLVAEFSGKLSTAAAIGAFEIVKHELIANALEGES